MNLWTRWQALEYITSQNFERRALNTAGRGERGPGRNWGVATSSSPRSGRIPSRHRRRRCRPDDGAAAARIPRGVRRPRARLHRSSGQRKRLDASALPLVVRDSAGGVEALAECSARKGVLGWVALPNILVFQILLPMVSPFIDIMFVVGAMWYLIQKYFHPESTDPAELPAAGDFLCRCS